MNRSTRTRTHAGSRERAGRDLGRIVRHSLLLLFVIPLLLCGLPALADADLDEGYEPTEAGHPLRIVAYVLHPVGVILDTLIFRPAWWLGTHEPIKTLVGNTD
jgi:hypothetical protein